jgi:hypothetical protein
MPAIQQQNSHHNEQLALLGPVVATVKIRIRVNSALASAAMTDINRFDPQRRMPVHDFISMAVKKSA